MMLDKVINTGGVLASGVLGISLLGTGSAYADAPVVDDLNDVTSTQAVYYAGYVAPYGSTVKQDNSKITSANTSAVPLGDPVTNPGDTWYVGSTTLRNNTDADQALSTQSFSQQISQTVSTSVTNGLSTTYGVNAKFTVPGVDLEPSLNQTVSFSQTDTKTSSAEQTYTAPSQNIVVPAHSTAKVSVVLQSVHASGKMALHTDLAGTGNYRVMYKNDPNSDTGYSNDFNNVPLYALLGAGTAYGQQKQNPPPLPTSFKVDTANHNVHFDGTGTYTATYGADMIVTVDLTPNSAGLQSRQSYSYTLKPTLERR